MESFDMQMQHDRCGHDAIVMSINKNCVKINGRRDKYSTEYFSFENNYWEKCSKLPFINHFYFIKLHYLDEKMSIISKSTTTFVWVIFALINLGFRK